MLNQSWNPNFVSFWILPQDGGCTLHYTPNKYFQSSFFNYSIIILPTCHHFPHLFDGHSIYKTNLKHYWKFRLYLIFLCVVKFKFFSYQVKSTKYFQFSGNSHLVYDKSNFQWISKGMIEIMPLIIIPWHMGYWLGIVWVEVPSTIKLTAHLEKVWVEFTVIGKEEMSD